MSKRGNKNQTRITNDAKESIPLDDVVWGTVDMDEYDEMPLVPLDETEELHRPRQRETMLTLGTVYDEVEEPIDLKFSLWHILIGQGIIALCLGVMRILGLFAIGGFAGTLGVLSIIVGVFISVYEPDDKRSNLVWAALIVFYLLACIVAIVVG